MNERHALVTANEIVRALNENPYGHPFTRLLVKAAEMKLPEGIDRQGIMLDMVREAETFCSLYRDRLEYPFLKEIAEGLISCAKNDIMEGEPYMAISDIETPETIYRKNLREELSQIDAPDAIKFISKRQVESLLRIHNLEGYVEVDEEKNEIRFSLPRPDQCPGD